VGALLVGVRLERDPGDLALAAQATWLGRGLEDAQERALLLARVRPGADDPSVERIVFDCCVALNSAAVEQLLKVGRDRGEPVQAVLPGRFGSLVDQACDGDPPFLMGYLPGDGQVASIERLRVAPKVELDLPERSLDIPVSADAFGAEVVSLPVSDAFLFPMHHWSQALWANLLGLAPFLWRELAGYTWPAVIWRLFSAAVRVRSLQPERVLRGLRRVGKGSHVAPGAVIEGSLVGRGARIGAGAVVRGSVIGDGAHVEPGGFVEFSVIGPGARVTGRGRVVCSVLSAESKCGGDVLMTMLGRSSQIDAGVVLRDIGANEQETLRTSAGTPPLGLLGVGLEKNAWLRAGCRVGPAVTIPVDCDVAPARSTRLVQTPSEAPGPHRIVDGTLEPV
jgi:hypothetical protein